MYLTLSFKFSSREEVVRFLSFLEKHLRTTYLVTTRLDHVYVQLEGEEKELEEAAALVKRLAGLARQGRGVVQIPLLVLFRDANLARPIPPDAVADALTLSGVASHVRGDVLETSAPYEEVLKTAEALSRMYEEAERLPLTPQARKVAVAYAYARGVPIEKAVEELAEAGLLNKGSVISLRYPLEEVRRRLQSLNRPG
ncbi:DUF2067 family protein [Pyrobaculum sp.]|uniref:DUF2067 family protein n=1 Tax=Pyrobaculum sp. TaxID=2004705 RepID=UPI0031636050